MFLISSSHVVSGTTEDVIEGAGELSKFGIDVLEDFGLEGKTAEESGKARFEDLLKGKAKDFVKDTLTGGGDLSEGMGLILNKIFDGINSKKGLNACQIAALNQAWGIAFDAKNTRLLRGAANIWFDILTSIPGAPALAEKLVMETGEAAYKKLRSEIESKIKEAWAKQKDESFKLTKQSGPCSITMTVLWNKKKNKYLFLITGKCDCKLIPIEPLGRGGTITMKSFQVIGGGSIKPVVDISDPKNPKVRLVASLPSSIKVAADCDCAEQTFLPPPKEEPIDEWISAPRMEARVSKAKCEACQPLLDTAIGLVGDFNKLADRMDALGKLIMAEKYKTPERDANIEEWNKLSKQQDEIEKKHDEVFQRFATCEEEECKLGTEAFQLAHTSEQSTTSTSCSPCQSIVDDINKLVEKHNTIAKQMNALADAASRAGLKHGTVEGNKTYKKWHELSKQVTDLSNQIAKKHTEKSQCEAKNCFGVKPFEKIKLTSACDACSGIQARLNTVEKEYNDHVDYVNGLWKAYQDFLVKGGDRGSKEGSDLSGKARKEGDKFEEMWDRMSKLNTELRACDPSKCDVAEDGSKIKIGYDFESVVDELHSIGVTAQEIDIICSGPGCTSEPIAGMCIGNTCPDTFTLECSGSSCTERIQLDCVGNTCPSDTKLDCGAGGCPEITNFICTDNQCNYVTPPPGREPAPGISSDVPFNYDAINFGALDIYSDGHAYSDGTFQVPYSGPLLNSILGLDEEAAPTTALQQLLQAEQQAIQNAINANNYANTVADAFQQAGSTSIQTASSLAAATEAAGTQKFLIDFGSALADLASVSDFFEGFAKGDMSDNSLLQNLDSIYEAAKDGESLANNIADQIQPIPDGSGISTSPINDAFGTMGVADDYWGTDGLNNINAMKSNFSDITNLIDDHRSGKPINPRTLGQLIFRVGKGFAENDLKEREQQIANLQQDLAAEQRTSSGLAGQLQIANEAKWNAMDELASIRTSIAALLATNPETISIAISGESPVVTTTAKCPACQLIADLIDQAIVAMYAARQKIAAIQAGQQALEAKKARLQQLQDQLASADRVLNTARAGLQSTDVPVLGPAQEIQNRINLLEMDRRQLVNEIGRLEREIEIEEGDPESEIESLQNAIEQLRQQLEQLRYNLFVCEEDKCKKEGADVGRFFGEIFSVEIVDVKNISGNNPYDRRDPLSSEGNIAGGEPTVQVVNNIPIARLILIGPEAGCPANHYHGNANNCNGVFTVDPNPPGCGHGTVAAVISIPVSACPDL